MASVLVLLVLLTSGRTAACDPGDPAAAALTVAISEMPDAVRVRIQPSKSVQAGSVDVRFSGRKIVVFARDGEGRPSRSQTLRLSAPVVEDGSSAEYDADGALVMTLRKQATAARARKPEAVVR